MGGRGRSAGRVNGAGRARAGGLPGYRVTQGVAACWVSSRDGAGPECGQCELPSAAGGDTVARPPVVLFSRRPAGPASMVQRAAPPRTCVRDQMIAVRPWEQRCLCTAPRCCLPDCPTRAGVSLCRPMTVGRRRSALPRNMFHRPAPFGTAPRLMAWPWTHEQGPITTGIGPDRPMVGVFPSPPFFPSPWLPPIPRRICFFGSTWERVAACSSATQVKR